MHDNTHSMTNIIFFFQIDPVRELLTKFMGEQEADNRKTLSVDSVPLDETGLRELLVCLWRSNFVSS